jgi:CRP/FNR family transcriptional regulator
MLDHYVRVLAESPLLDLLPNELHVELASRARPLHFAAGETVFAVDTPGTLVYWVLKGRFRLTTTAHNGSELIHGMIEVGDYCGEITAIDGGLRGVTAIAERSSDAIALDRQYLLPAIERTPGAAMKLARLLCVHIRTAGANMHNLALHNSELRLWSRLMQLCEQYAQIDKNGYLRIDHGLSQQSLADSIGLTRVMVNRQLREWQFQGFIEDGRGYIIIPNAEQFKAFIYRER